MKSSNIDQSDFLSAYLRPHEESQTLLINQQSMKRVAEGEKIYRFGFGQSPFPVPNEICEVLADSAHRKEYMSVQGDPSLREAIVGFHALSESKQWQAEQIIIGAGSKILIYCLMAALEKAEVAIPAPSWVSYEPQANLIGHTVSWIQTHFDQRWCITPSQVRAFCMNREDTNIPLFFIFNYPSNPTGQTYSRAQLQELAAVFEEFGVIVIADEIYSLLSYEQDRATLEEYYPQGTIVSSGISKWCGAGGWRLGFVHIPAQLGSQYFKTVVGVASETYSCAASPIQVAATAAYNRHDLSQLFISKQVSILSAVSRYCAMQLSNAGVAVHGAQGGFYIFPDFSNFSERLRARGIHGSIDLTAALLEETGVALLPGSAFGMPAESLTARLAFVDFDGSQIGNDVRIYKGEGVDFEFDKVKEGILKIIDWLNTCV